MGIPRAAYAACEAQLIREASPAKGYDGGEVCLEKRCCIVRLVSCPVDMLAVHLRGKAPRPVRFRYRPGDGHQRVVKVDRILRVDQRRMCGDRVFHYVCENGSGAERRRYRLQYILNEDKWEIFWERP